MHISQNEYQSLQIECNHMHASHVYTKKSFGIVENVNSPVINPSSAW